MIYLHLCLIAIDTLFHPIVCLMYTHVLKLGMILPLLICHFLFYQTYQNMLYLNQNSHQIFWYLLFLIEFTHIHLNIPHSIFGICPKSNSVISLSSIVYEPFLCLFTALKLKLWFIMWSLSCWI